MGTYKILIAEDDVDIIEVLSLYLNSADFDVVSAEDGEKAWNLIKSTHIDLCLFDIMMPGISGYDLIKKVRSSYNMPIIVLSAKREDNDRIVGLDLGADDYLTKPFNPLEVVAHVKAALRRAYQLNVPSAEAADHLEAGPFHLDLQGMKLQKNGEEIILTATELKMMILFMKHPGRVYTKVQISEYLNGEYFENDENTVMVHISNLRNKIEEDSKNPTYLITIRGLGYELKIPRN